MNGNKISTLLKSTASADERKAFSLLFHHYYQRLVQFAQLFVYTRCRAEDTVSDVLMRLIRHRQKLFLLENFEAYLFRSVKNEALNKLKSERIAFAYNREMSSMNTAYHHDDPHQTFVELELSRQISEAIGKLPPKRRQVYRLIKDDGLRYKDVAQLMEISERTVEVHLRIAVRELQYAIALYLER